MEMLNSSDKMANPTIAQGQVLTNIDVVDVQKISNFLWYGHHVLYPKKS